MYIYKTFFRFLYYVPDMTIKYNWHQSPVETGLL